MVYDRFHVNTTLFTFTILGGFSQLARDYVNRIWKYDSSWSVVGYTQMKRSNYRTVLVGNVAYTAGGFGIMNNERWSFDDQLSSILTTTVSNTLFPELIPAKYLNCAIQY